MADTSFDDPTLFVHNEHRYVPLTSLAAPTIAALGSLAGALALSEAAARLARREGVPVSSPNARAVGGGENGDEDVALVAAERSVL